MKRRLLMTIIVACLLMSNHALAFSFSEYYGEQMRKHASATNSILAEISAIEDEEIPADLLNRYYTEACWMVYSGLVVYAHEYDQLPQSLDELSMSGHVEFWPVDPIANLPMGLSDVSDPQSGTFVLQVAPPSHYSIIGGFDSYRLEPLSYELSVIADTGMQAQMSSTINQNTWAMIPDGSIFQVGYYVESADITLQKLEERVREQTKKSKSDEEESHD